MATESATAELTPLEYVARADKELAFGKRQKAAGYLWKAIEATFIGLAKERELDCGDLFKVAKTLEAETTLQKNYPSYGGGLSAGETLREHADSAALEGYQLGVHYDAARKFIVKRHGELE